MRKAAGWVWGFGLLLVFQAQGFAVLYCSFRSLAFWGLLGFLVRQLKFVCSATLLGAAKRVS